MSAEEKASSSLTDSKGSNVTANAGQPIHIRFATTKLSHVANIPKRGSNSLTVTLLISFAIPVYLEILDYTVVAPSEFRIASAFNGLESASLIGSIYHLLVATFVPLFASIADVYGRHSAIQSALVLFFIGSALSTGAANIPMLLVGRGISGIGVAGLLTVVRIITSDSASLNPAHWQAYVLVFLSAVGFSTGPVIGSAVTAINFRWVFAINLPSSALAMAIIFMLLRKIAKGPKPQHINCPCSEEKKRSHIDRLLHIDWISAICFTAGGILILYGLNLGSQTGYNLPAVIASLTVGSSMIFMSLIWQYIIERVQTNRLIEASLAWQWTERDSKHSCYQTSIFKADAMIPIYVLRTYDTVVTQFAAFTAGMAMVVIAYYLGIFLSVAVNMPLRDVGLRLIRFTPGMSTGMVIGILMVNYFHRPKWPILIGSSLIPISVGLITWAIPANALGWLSVFMVMSGLGVGMTFGPLASQSRGPQRFARVPIVVLNLFFRSLGATVGLAQSSTILNSFIRRFIESTTGLDESGNQLSSDLTFASLTSLQDISDLEPELQAMLRNAYRNGCQWVFIAILPWLGLSLLLCLFLTTTLPTKPPPPKRESMRISRRFSVSASGLERQLPASVDSSETLVESSEEQQHEHHGQHDNVVMLV